MKQTPRKLLLSGATIAAIAALSTGSAMADSGDGRKGGGMFGGMGAGFSDLDADGDGMLTEEEFAAAQSTWFASHDADGDGMLSQDELNAAILASLARMAEKRSAAIIGRLDADGDGMIAMDEIEMDHDPARAFSRMDRDDDGMISESEFDRKKSRDGRKGRRWGRKGHDND